ncbi:MAG: aminotransferase class V-fold PLP-dependent enzyme [Pseudomonadota bacterium]
MAQKSKVRQGGGFTRGEDEVGLRRRQVLGAGLSAVAGAVALPAMGKVGLYAGDLPTPPANAVPAELARDETFWREIARHYPRTSGIVNLEHGYWGKMARPVQAAYMAATEMVNTQNSYYGRKGYRTDAKLSVQRVARALGAGDDEIVLTRNATEAIHNLIRQYRGLEPGDAVLYADVDYPQFKTTMHWLKQGRGVEVVRLDLPSRAESGELLGAYRAAFDANPRLKLMLATHASNQHGLVLPIADIAAEARGRGIDVICDCAQSWGLVDYRIEDLGVDWAGFNLHKWIGSPIGVGALYMRRGSLDRIAPYPGEQDSDNTRAWTRIHTGTANFAAMASVPAALDFHEALGGANKEARLRYLRSLWSVEADEMSHIEVLGGAEEDAWTGMGAFRLAGKASVEDAKALQLRLEDEFGIFTVVRRGLASGSCVRITPQVFTTPDEVGRLVDAMRRLRA